MRVARASAAFLSDDSTFRKFDRQTANPPTQRPRKEKPN